jgi:hypothetical protein
MSDRSIDRITFLLNANREAGRKLQEELQRHRQEQDKAEQARLDKIAATQRKHAEEADAGRSSASTMSASALPQ